jgi:membrane protein required for colicin V production
MDGFTWIDLAVAGIIVVSAILAYSRGLVRELMAILGWVAAAILAFTFAGAAEPLVREIPYLGDFLGDSCELAVLAAFALVFALALVVTSFFTPLLSSAVHRSAIGGIDRGLGFLFGALRGILLVAVAFFVYDTILESQNVEMVEDSRAKAVFGSFTERLQSEDPEQALGWITTQYEQLVGGCGPQ